MDPGSVGREVKPQVRVVTMTVIVWFVVRSVMGTTVPRIIMMVSVNPVVPAIVFVMVPLTNSVIFLMTIVVMAPVTGPCAVITCLRRRRPNDQKHCQNSDYYNLTDVFHFDPPFIRMSRRGEEKGYGFIKVKSYGWVEKEKRSHL